MLGEPALGAATRSRLERAQAGEDVRRHLSIATLEPGVFGVLQCTIVQVHPVQTYRRKQGGEGLLGRVRLSDGTREAELVLWDDETMHIRDGTFVAGAGLVLAGATVKPGYRGGLELGLRGASWSIVSPAPPGLRATVPDR